MCRVILSDKSQSMYTVTIKVCNNAYWLVGLEQGLDKSGPDIYIQWLEQSIYTLQQVGYLWVRAGPIEPSHL